MSKSGAKTEIDRIDYRPPFFLVAPARCAQ